MKKLLFFINCSRKVMEFNDYGPKLFRAIVLERPKSQILTSQLGLISIFAGFKSLCITLD